MKDENKIYQNGEKLFGSGFIWFITSIILVIFPTMCSYLYKCIAAEKWISITEYYSDILLLFFSISCNLFALCINRYKLIHKRMKKIGLIISCIFSAFSGTFYFFIEGLGKKPFIHYVCIASLICICVCSVFGWILEYKHDKYSLAINSNK